MVDVNELFSHFDEALKIVDDGFTNLFQQDKNDEMELDSMLDDLRKVMTKFNKTKDVNVLSKHVMVLEGKKMKTGRKKKTAESIKKEILESVDKENTPLAANEGRSRRRAFDKASQSVSQQVALPLNSKLRRDDQIGLPEVTVKVERLSQECINEYQNIKVKSEKQEMPPPRAVPARRTKKKEKVEKPAPPVRVTRSKVKKASTLETVMETKTDPNDVIICSPKISTISIDDTFESVDNEPKSFERSTRQSSKNDKSTESKRNRSSSGELNSSKRSKPSEGNENQENVTSEDDGEEEVYKTPEGKKGDITTRISQPRVLLENLPNINLEVHQEASNPNATITITRNDIGGETFVVPKESDLLHAILTDDDSVEEDVPVKPKKAATKAIFDPFENSPVKKRVEAFEKLAGDGSTMRVTRTKTRQKNNEAQNNDENVAASAPAPKKNLTPNNKINYPLKTGSTSKLHFDKYPMSNTLSALRSVQQEMKTRESEAAKRKEAMLQQQIEEKRRKRIEKEMKAKLQREALDKEKVRLLEAQKQKDEKLKHREAEKMEKMQKAKEEIEKKRLLVKLRQEEIRREEEQRRFEAERVKRQREEEERNRLAEEKRRLEEEFKKASARLNAEMQQTAKENAEKQQKANLPLYMTTETPLLPTADCYDSDEEDNRNIALPEWMSRPKLHATCRAMEYIDQAFINTLFSSKPQSLHLPDLFPNIDPRNLRRNSSFIWDYEPRYTLMPNVSQWDLD